MDITQNLLPGTGTVYHCRTRGGQRFALLIAETGGRSLLMYDPADLEDPDVPRLAIVLEQDEADQVADILHSRSTQDRLAAVERRLTELTQDAP